MSVAMVVVCVYTSSTSTSERTETKYRILDFNSTCISSLTHSRPIALKVRTETCKALILRYDASAIRPNRHLIYQRCKDVLHQNQHFFKLYLVCFILYTSSTTLVYNFFVS